MSVGATFHEMAGMVGAGGANADGQATASNISSPVLDGSLQELSFTSFISSIILGLSIMILQLLIFSALRKRLRFIYEPRTFLAPENRRVHEGPNGFLAWIKPLVLLPLEEIAQSSGLDAYFLLRYLLFHLGFWATMCCGVMPILIPINITSKSGVSGSFLEKLSWENTALYAPDRLIIHCLVGIILIVLLCYYIYRELQAFVAIRHQHVTQSSSRGSSMVLIRQVPRNYLYEPKLIQVFENYPGGLKRIWINRDYHVLINLIEQRDRYLQLLETAELKLIRKAYTIMRKKEGSTKKRDTTALDFQTPASDGIARLHSIEEDYTTGMKWMKYLKPEDLPTYTISRAVNIFKPKKVDALTFFKSELDRINSEIEKYQSDSTILCPLVASCLVEFNSSAGSQIACSQGSKVFCSTHFTLTPPSVVHVENSSEIIWENLNVSITWLFLRNFLSTILKVITIFGWSFPVAFIGIVSQIRFLIQLVPTLAAVNELSPAICETLSSVIPPIILQLLFSFVPKIFYFLAILKKYPLNVLVTLDIEQNLFVFSFIQIFLVLTLSTGITRAIYQAFKFPTSVPALLAANLPKSATFFSSYTVLQGISIAGNELLRIDGLFRYFVSQRLFTCTGRDVHRTNMDSMDSIDFAPLFATIANLGTITIAYSIISPVILVTSVLAFFLMFYSYKYRIVYLTTNETNGLLYPNAILQLFYGVYCLEACMIGLFLSSYEQQRSAWCAFSALLMIISMAGTGIFHWKLSLNFSPFMKNLDFGVSNTSDYCRSLQIQKLRSQANRAVSGSTTEQGLQSDYSKDIPEDTEEKPDTYPEYFDHPALTSSIPCVWIPRDIFGIGEDQAAEIRLKYKNLLVSTNGYTIDDASLKSAITTSPPSYHAGASPPTTSLNL